MRVLGRQRGVAGPGASWKNRETAAKAWERFQMRDTLSPTLSARLRLDHGGGGHALENRVAKENKAWITFRFKGRVLIAAGKTTWNSLLLKISRKSSEFKIN